MPRTPRYLDLAATLRKSISAGKVKLGAQLPTEHAICEQYDVSRHTARAALQVLEDAGLIERRPGLGTRVISTGAPAAFSQPLGGLDDLLQYAHEAKLKITGAEELALAPSSARFLGAPKGSRWLVLYGVRRADARAIAATTIYVAETVGAKPGDFRSAAKAVTEHIEDKYGISVAGITQTIRAELLNAEDAGALKAAAGQPILRTIRRYFDASDRLFVVSDTRHPSDRFVYEMTYKRTAKSKAP